MEASDLIKSPVKWYKTLIPKNNDAVKNNYCQDLLSCVSERDLSQGILVCALTSKNGHIFALFPSHVSFAEFHLSLVPEHRCFFEIILGDRMQKSHFDIDINLVKNPGIDGDAVLRAAIVAIIAAYKEVYGHELDPSTDILIFTSHGENKRSYHLIIDNYAHANNLEAKACYQEVISRIPDEYREFVDSAVYSKKQQFRIVGSRKNDGTGRTKTLMDSWTLNDTTINYRYKEQPLNSGHQLVLLLEASLVSRTNRCTVLKNILPETPAKKTQAWTSSDDDLHPTTVRAAFDLLGNKAGVSVTVPSFPYEIRDVIGSLILLKRRYPSICRVCNRLHEHENPYMFVIKDDNDLRHVYFDCRRADGRKLYLGILPEAQPNGEYLPDSPSLLVSQEILEKFEDITKLTMKDVRRARKVRPGFS